MTTLTFTRFTSTTPPVLTKRFSLTPDGALHKESVAQMAAGWAEQIRVGDLAEFGVALDRLTSAQATAYGVAPGFSRVCVVSQKHHRDGDGAITRTRRYFQFAPTPGILMADYDPPPGAGPLQGSALVEAITGAAPCLAGAPMLWRPSASSRICAADGRELTGITGQRLYIAVSDASLIPEAGAALNALLWAAGRGRVDVGAAGQVLVRSLVDATVWQPERLDFAAPPILGAGLTREAVPHRIIGEPGGCFDLRQLISAADGEVKSQAVKAQAVARAAAKPAAQAAVEAWVEQRAGDLAAARGISTDEAAAVLRRAASRLELCGDFLLIADNGDEISVGDILDRPERWHGSRFADPLEPDYGHDKRIAWANLRSGGRPYIYSHAHGGRYYALIRPAARIRLSVGERARVVDQLLDLARGRGELYDYGDGSALARITDDARVQPVAKDWLVDHFERTAQFYAVKVRDDGTPVEHAQNAPTWAAAAILAKDGERRLPRLDATITAPTLRRDGSILSEPGFDELSRLLLRVDSPDAIHITQAPTLAQAKEALAELWAPFRLFPLVDHVDRGVVLAGILTGLVRASLPTAPGFGFDAPTAGSGKTLLAQAIGALSLGAAPAALPPASAQDEETRKRLFSALRDGHRVLLWDNVREPLGNGAMDAFLTAPQFSDRILGKSEMATLPNRALFLATGNNLRLVGDTCRRILVARMDPEMEKPYARAFDFCPLQTVLGNRLRLVAAGLSIIRAWITAGRPRRGTGRTASFEDWDDLVRQPVCWVASWDDRFADPLKATERAFEHDPETAKLAALLSAWHEVAGDSSRTVAQMRKLSGMGADTQDPVHPALAEAMEEIAGDNRGNINPRILGRWIERQAERRVGGLRFVRKGESHKVTLWAVRNDFATNPKKPVKTPQTPLTTQAAKSGDTDKGGVYGFRGVFLNPPEIALGAHAPSLAFQAPSSANTGEIGDGQQDNLEGGRI